MTAVEVGGARVEQQTTARWLGFDPGGRGGLAPLGMAGLIGHAVLEDHLVMLDYPGQRIALAPSSSAPIERDLHEWHLGQVRRDRTPDGIRHRARLLAYLGERDEALRLLERWHDESPADLEAIALHARVLRLEGRVDDARLLLASLDSGDLVDSGEIVAAVNALWLAGDVAGAGRLAESAVAARPTDAQAWVATADALRAAGDPAGARGAIRTANRISGNPDGHLIRRAWIAGEDDDIYGSITHARRLLDLHPAGGMAAWMYARAVAGTDDEALFRRDAERALGRLHPGDGPLDFLAASYGHLGESERARALMDAGRERDCSQGSEAAGRSNCEAWYRAMAGHDIAQARMAIDEALDEHPYRTEFLDTKAAVLEAQGSIEDARNVAWHAASIAPDDVYLLWQAARLDAATHESR